MSEVKKRCTYRHHASFGEDVICPKCKGPSECGPFAHACKKCNPEQFRTCVVCRQPVYRCSC